MYDSVNRPLATVDALGNRTTYPYDLQDASNLRKMRNGHFVTNVFDSMGRLQFVVNALSENAHQHTP